MQEIVLVNIIFIVIAIKYSVYPLFHQIHFRSVVITFEIVGIFAAALFSSFQTIFGRKERVPKSRPAQRQLYFSQYDCLHMYSMKYCTNCCSMHVIVTNKHVPSLNRDGKRLVNHRPMIHASSHWGLLHWWGTN